MAGSCSLSMPQVKRRLLNQVTGSLETLLVKFAEGRGEVQTGDWSESADQTPLEAGSSASAWPQEPFDYQQPQETPQRAQPVVPAEDEMDDFSAKAGVPNAFGLLGGEANAVEAHKRPLSAMTPIRIATI